MYPDHPEANKLGCKCPIGTPNNQGAGSLVDGIREWKINPICPIHADPNWWFRKPALPQPMP